MKKFPTQFPKKQWIKFAIWGILYTLFAIWMRNLWLLLGLFVLVDIFLTKFVPWGAWKKSKNPKVQNMLEWVDDILFALIAVYLINLFVFQNYQIPSSSLEKSLLVGDYLFVSKLSYGPRVPNTPLSFPLVQNTFPITNSKSYSDWPHWDYKRVAGLGEVKRNDIVVFNFPAGDTVALKVQNPDYYTLIAQHGREAIALNKSYFGDVIYRPVDKRENYVKRCIGMPGDSLEVRDNQVYINGVAGENPKEMQLNYLVEVSSVLSDQEFRLLNVSREDQNLFAEGGTNGKWHAFLGIPANEEGMYNMILQLPLTQEMVEKAKKLPKVKSIRVEPESIFSSLYYPVDYPTGWGRDNYGPIWIPKKGATIELTEWNIGLYHRCIRNYENNELEVKNGTVYLNGQPATTYTFQYDYYWMMGDNRHKSADSRSWGFVPEDHVVGKPILIWLSLDKDRSLFDGGIRWGRMFRMVHK
ncbi:signal peptidase I [Parabacteroides sp. PF5-6]|uniref:signal peptidase I n=1 Tax=Parabacteroides sp. PF5-6 TaxID=1742403 RepID=UPI00240716A7|nr:signal peptidase I [Parabacteroides sp. PF5-6]MDF9830504.1 signal peptidase I [Parabacteroides sp. PF5-6]